MSLVCVYWFLQSVLAQFHSDEIIKLISVPTQGLIGFLVMEYDASVNILYCYQTIKNGFSSEVYKLLWSVCFQCNHSFPQCACNVRHIYSISDPLILQILYANYGQFFQP